MHSIRISQSFQLPRHPSSPLFVCGRVADKEVRFRRDVWGSNRNHRKKLTIRLKELHRVDRF